MVWLNLNNSDTECITMDEDIETPELVDLQDTFAKTETTVVKDFPSDPVSDVEEGASGLTDSQKAKLPAALQNAILAKKGLGAVSSKKEEEEEGEPTHEMDLEKAIGEDAGETTEGIEGEEIFNNPTELEEPAGEFTPPVEAETVEPINPTPLSSTSRAEIYAAHSLAQKIASMPLADYEDWLFPPSGSPDNLRGQMCLARLDASLKAANGGRAVSELWQVKIGAALWSRLNYRNNPVEETRCELEKAPPMELIPLIPRNASEAISVIDEIQLAGSPSSSETNWGLIGACGVAVIIPLLLLRRG